MTVRVIAIVVLLTGASSLLTGAQSKVAVERTVYLSAIDQHGAPITDLTPADLTIKEGGKERSIQSVEPATARLKIAIAIDELVAPALIARQAVMRFFQQMTDSADIALYLVGRVNEKRSDYTSDVMAFLSAINGLPPATRSQGNLVESLAEIAKEQRAVKGRRVIVAVAPEFQQLSAVTADSVFEELRGTNAALYAVTLVGSTTSKGTLQPSGLSSAENGSFSSRLEGGDITQLAERDRVVNDGPKQSGGLRLPSNAIEGFQAALDRVGADLRHQYAVTYVVPAGSKSDGLLSISTKHSGMTIRGPKRVPPL